MTMAMTSTPSIMAGFAIEKLLGEGATSRVLLGRRPEDGKRVVIKHFIRDFGDETPRVRFKRECKALQFLSHPNIVSLIDYGVRANQAFMVFDYLPGETLREKLNRGQTFSGIETCQILAAIASALGCAHEAKILHRDVKPENILIADDGVPILIDFGLAQSELMHTFKTATGILLGTPAYMAPELFIDGKATASSDLYSLGCVMAEMLTGRVLFSGSLAKVLSTKKKPYTQDLVIPIKLNTLLKELLAPYEDRPVLSGSVLSKRLLQLSKEEGPSKCKTVQIDHKEMKRDAKNKGNLFPIILSTFLLMFLVYQLTLKNPVRSMTNLPRARSALLAASKTVKKLEAAGHGRLVREKGTKRYPEDLEDFVVGLLDLAEYAKRSHNLSRESSLYEQIVGHASCFPSESQPELLLKKILNNCMAREQFTRWIELLAKCRKNEHRNHYDLLVLYESRLRLENSYSLVPRTKACDYLKSVWPLFEQLLSAPDCTIERKRLQMDYLTLVGHSRTDEGKEKVYSFVKSELCRPNMSNIEKIDLLFTAARILPMDYYDKGTALRKHLTMALELVDLAMGYESDKGTHANLIFQKARIISKIAGRDHSKDMYDEALDLMNKIDPGLLPADRKRLFWWTKGLTLRNLVRFPEAEKAFRNALIYCCPDNKDEIVKQLEYLRVGDSILGQSDTH